MHFLELKLPPLLVAVLTAVLMWLVSWAFPRFVLILPARDVLAVCFAVVGALIIIVSIASFRRARTTINPMKPESSSALVDSGVYGLSRNPMYLGFLFVLVGWAIYLSNVLAFLILPVYIVYMDLFQIEPEEKALAGKFGREFDAYKARVRRWL